MRFTPDSHVKPLTFLFVLLLLLFTPAQLYSQAGTRAEVFKIYYQKAQDIGSAVKAVLSANGVVTVVPGANALVVRDYARNLKLVKKLIAQLDSRPKNISITVEFIEETELRTAGVIINWRVANSGLSIGTIPSPARGANIDLKGSLSSLKVTRTQFLELLENRQGRIFVGESVPFTDYYFSYGVNHGYLGKSVTFKNAGTSFLVTAKTVPNKKIRVILEPEISYYDKSRNTFLVKSAVTEVVIDDPGKIVIASMVGDRDSFGSKFLMGVESGKKETRFVIIISARSQ